MYACFSPVGKLKSVTVFKPGPLIYNRYVNIGTAYHKLLKAVYTVIAQQIGDHRYNKKANKAAHRCAKLAGRWLDIFLDINKLSNCFYSLSWATQQAWRGP